MCKPDKAMFNHFRRYALGLTGSLLLLMSDSMSPLSKAAEKITFKFGPFSRSISMADLRQYAKNAEAPPELASLLNKMKSEQRDSQKKGLNTSLPFSVIQMDQLLRSEPGTRLLPQIAQLTFLPGGSEELALRSALIGAAASDEGLTVLKILETYPTPNLTVDMKAMQKFLKSSQGIRSLLDGLGK